MEADINGYQLINQSKNYCFIYYFACLQNKIYQCVLFKLEIELFINIHFN